MLGNSGAIGWAFIAGAILSLHSGRVEAGVPDYDFQWSVIGDVNNPAYDGPDPYGIVGGRGSVSYQYRISRLEVTTAQWMEFVNTYSTQFPDMWNFGMPARWGAEPDPDYNGIGLRWRLRTDVPNAGMLPVGGISWREAAMLCNWLSNSKATDLAAIEDGAYDTSTFGPYVPGVGFPDQAAHHPDAKFWIPTLDELLKSVHYDPDRFGQGEGGWWMYPHTSDTAPVGGPPGEGEANTGFQLPDEGHWDIPLGSYPDVMSPWGLWDTSGAAAEWIEDWSLPAFPVQRFADGTAAGNVEGLDRDLVWEVPSGPPIAAGISLGVRIASIVPTPSGAPFVCAVLLLISTSRRRV